MPLKIQYKQSFTHLTEKPKMMQPKSNKVNQVVEADTVFCIPWAYENLNVNHSL